MNEEKTPIQEAIELTANRLKRIEREILLANKERETLQTQLWDLEQIRDRAEKPKQ